MMEVFVYTLTGYGPCKLFKMWLRIKKTPYEEKNILENEDQLNEFLVLEAKGVLFTVIEGDGTQTHY